MILFSTSSYEYLAKSLRDKGNMPHGEHEAARFANGTILIRLKTQVRGEHCAILGGTAPSDELMELSLLAHTLKKEGASKVTVIAPYLSYSRQDENTRGESWGIKWLGAVLAASGVDEVVTIHLHNPMVTRDFAIPLISLSTAKLLSIAIGKQANTDFTFVAPDEGAVDNCADLNRELGGGKSISFFKKKRSAEGVKILSLHGEVSGKAVIPDDILDSGETLVRVCRELKKQGIKKIIVAVTHGLFIGSVWRELWKLGVEKIYCTDSDPRALKLASKKLYILSVAELIINYFNK